MKFKASNKCIETIKYFEGCKLNAYKCSANKTTIGIGTTVYPNGNEVKLGDTCTLEQAEMYLKHDLTKFEEAVNRLVGLHIHQLMFDSLVCFTYNVGIGNLQSSSLLKMINLGKFEEASLQFIKWNKARVNGELTVLNGLTKRREAEKELFLQGLKELQIQEIIGG